MKPIILQNMKETLPPGTLPRGDFRTKVPAEIKNGIYVGDTRLY